MIKQRFYLEIAVDEYNRYIVDGDPRDEYVTLSRQKRNHVEYGWTVLGSIPLPVAGALRALDIAESLIDAVNLVGFLRDDQQELLDKFNSKDNRISNGARHSLKNAVDVTFVEFE